ncbi:RING-H2 finger protein ATL74-like [Pyrus x bretschneideri]|uniref:RING-H2 finger protein ATL74-like n=1 Tax=Pyrus x bretschneideri TaxID=225117 RepID=UPI00202E399F|nr:RING-H2 finger protein ATL74-like [Pyrus x bretschneideri]
MSSGSQDPNWKSWIIPYVAIICTFTLLFGYYKILRLICRPLESAGFSRNPNQSRVPSEFNLDDPSLQFQRNGLDFSIARSLPVTQFKKKDEAEAAERSPGQSNTDCAICLGEFEDGEWLKELPKCSHEFHISCIDAWFVSHSNCPICRSQVSDLMRDPPVPTQTPEETLSRDEVEERAAHFELLRSAVIDVTRHRGDLMT